MHLTTTNVFPKQQDIIKILFFGENMNCSETYSVVMLLFSFMKTIYDNFVQFQIKKTTGIDVVVWGLCYDKDNLT